MKKILALLMVVVMALPMVACRSTDSPDVTGGGDEGTEGYKIGILTGTVSQNEEEYRAAEKMKEQYGDKIVFATYPDNFMTETETTISNCVAIASDPEVKVIVFVQAVPGAAAAIDKVRETRPDMVFIAGVPGEDPPVIASKADIVLQADELAMGRTIVEEAVKMGAKNLVHYSFPRHMSYALLAARRDLLKENCAAAGINFVDATAPDPTGDAGVAGAQQFIMEDVPRKVNELGADTAFFSTNCAMQEPLIKQVMASKAIMVQQCCPSPYHAYPAALGIEIPEDKKGDVDWLVSEIGNKITEGDNNGRMGTWPVPINMVMVWAGVEYGIKYCEGETNGVLDVEALTAVLDEQVGGSGKMTVATYNEGGVELDNFFFLLSDYIVF